MLVSEIFSQITEVTGSCDETTNFQAISRAVELLSNEGLFDPSIAYLDFVNEEATNLITLPRDVKTVLRVNINNTPTFFRNRLFEFTLNGNGNDDGEELGFAWSDRGYLPIQDERKLPGHLSYRYENVADLDKTITVYGFDEEGIEIMEVIAAKADDSSPSTKAFFQIKRVMREPTAGICLLYCESDLAAQYYPDELDPMYRVIKLSKKASSVHMMYRREVQEIKSQTDAIPLHSKMAVIHATKAVRYFATDNYEKAMAALTFAIDCLKKEQASRDEQDMMAEALERPTIIDASITTRDSIVVADIYDEAAEIFGFVGRPKLFDKITTAIEVLRNKAHWDSGIGVADIWMTDRTELNNVGGGKGQGYFVLPRFVESVISLNLCGEPAIARNRWFEFHINGTGETNRASCGNWDDAGETYTLAPLLIDPDTRRVIPVNLVAIPNDEVDDNTQVRIYGYERLEDGTEAEVWREGERGFTVPCTAGSVSPGTDAPSWVSITRITKALSTGFIQLFVTDGTTAGRLMGFWYPDEVEPKYRAIKVAIAKANRIRVLYRKRMNKITSLYEPIPLRSRLAIVNMMRALKAQETDAQAAINYEQIAVNYLTEERINSVPSQTPSLQFDSSLMPGFTGNVT